MPDNVSPNSESTAHVETAINGVHQVQLRGDLDASMDLSGAVVVGDFLALGADEGHMLQIFMGGRKRGVWSLKDKIALAKQDQETDIEAIAYGDGHLYVIGSHSARRRRVKPELSVRKNRQRLLDVRQDEERNRLFRIPFDEKTGKTGKAKAIDLSKRLRKDPLLGRFHGIPGKENGLDIEGITYRDGRLMLGFRGPVLRQNYVPLMRLRFDAPKGYELLFVQLDGQGIRDLAAVGEGFLMLSGPVNDAPGPYRLWWWDGEDQIPGRGRQIRSAVLLGEVSTPGGAKAEGLAVLNDDGSVVEVIVVYETGTSAQAVRMSVRLP